MAAKTTGIDSNDEIMLRSTYVLLPLATKVAALSKAAVRPTVCRSVHASS